MLVALLVNYAISTHASSLAENDVSSANTPACANSRRIISGTAERTNSVRRVGSKTVWSQGCKSRSRSTNRSSGRDRSPSGFRLMVSILC